MLSEKHLLHEQIDALIDLEVVNVVGVPLQPHQQATVRHVGGSAIERWSQTCLAEDGLLKRLKEPQNCASADIFNKNLLLVENMFIIYFCIVFISVPTSSCMVWY